MLRLLILSATILGLAACGLVGADAKDKTKRAADSKQNGADGKSDTDSTKESATAVTTDVEM